MPERNCVTDELPPCIGDTFGGNPVRPDQVTITRAEYAAGNQELRVEAEECCVNSATMLWATVASTGEVIGILEFKGLIGNVAGKFEGRFSWPVNPSEIKVISSPAAGWNRSAVTLK